MGMKTALLKSALARSISDITESMKDVVQDSVLDLARTIGRWAKGTAILFGIGAALGLVALVALALGLAQLLIAAGLPPFAGYLIVAAVAGVAAFVLFKAGATRRVARSPGPEADRSPIRVRIESPKAPRRRSSDVRRSRRRWELRGPGAERRTFRSRGSARRAARRAAARSRARRVVIRFPNDRGPFS
jgi:hypothetical protein